MEAFINTPERNREPLRRWQTSDSRLRTSLQTLIAEHPELLAREQIRPERTYRNILPKDPVRRLFVLEARAALYLARASKKRRRG